MHLLKRNRLDLEQLYYVIGVLSSNEEAVAKLEGEIKGWVESKFIKLATTRESTSDAESRVIIPEGGIESLEVTVDEMSGKGILARVIQEAHKVNLPVHQFKYKLYQEGVGEF